MMNKETDHNSQEKLRQELKALQKELDKAKTELETQQWGMNKTNKALRLLYAKLEDQNKELLKLDQLKSDFVSTVSHELRTPLAISTEGINLILDGLVGDISDKQRNLLTTAKENLERLNMIINDLLDISKIEAGKVELRPVFFDIVQHLMGITESYQPVATKKKIKLINKFPSKVVTLYVDKDKITQVVTNLLSNAYKFTAEGGFIELGLTLEDSKVVCSVKDSGIGIEKEHLPKLFKKFQQISREHGPGIKGTGLGLAISKNLIEVHGGKIWVESKLGQGTTFYFSLPLYEQMKEAFDKQFDVLLQNAKLRNKSLGVLIVQLRNADDIRVKHGDEALMDIMNKILFLVSGVLSNPDDKCLLYDIHSIYLVLPEAKLRGVHSVINRIRKSIEKSPLGSKDSAVKLNIKYGASYYPESAESREELIEIALKDISRQKKILVIDDQEQIFQILQSRLEQFGYQVETALDGERALALMKEEKPDLVVLDIMMPGINGYEVFGRMKADPVMASIPIIILTAKNEDIVRKEAPQVEGVPVITKTGDFNHLVDLIHQKL